ncbi:MAG: transcriptional regulator GcvA [Acidiferrobacterales bacterium]
MARRLPPLGALQAFEAAGRYMSFTKAADNLYVTKSAISHQIKTLEDYLGVKLFHRSARQLALTQAGEACFPTLKEGFDRLAVALDRVNELETRDVLKISVSPSFAAKWLVPRLGQFEMLYPDIDVHMCAPIDVANLMREEVDSVIRKGPSQYPGLRVDQLWSELVLPVCSPSLLSGVRALRVPHDLRWHRLIHVDGVEYDDAHPDWASWLDAAGLRDIDPTRGLRFSLLSLAIQAAIEGRGVALVGSVLVEDDLATGRLVKPFDFDYPDFSHAHCIVTTEVAAKLPRVRAFRDWLLEQAAVPGERTKGTPSTPQPNSPVVGRVGENPIKSNRAKGGKNKEKGNSGEVEEIQERTVPSSLRRA